MGKKQIIKNLVSQWLNIAEKDLITARQGLNNEIIVTETICFHCQQAAEKLLKAFLVQNQVEFSKTHSIQYILNVCSSVDETFKKELSDADILTDYAVEIRYPDDWYEPSIEEAKEAYEIALKVKRFVFEKLALPPSTACLHLPKP